MGMLLQGLTERQRGRKETASTLAVLLHNADARPPPCLDTCTQHHAALSCSHGVLPCSASGLGGSSDALQHQN